MLHLLLRPALASMGSHLGDTGEMEHGPGSPVALRGRLQEPAGRSPSAFLAPRGLPGASPHASSPVSSNAVGNARRGSRPVDVGAGHGRSEAVGTVMGARPQAQTQGRGPDGMELWPHSAHLSSFCKWGN